MRVSDQIINQTVPSRIKMTENVVSFSVLNEKRRLKATIYKLAGQQPLSPFK